MASRQHDKLRGAGEEKCIGHHQERIGAHLDQLRKGRIDVANGAGIQDVDLLADAAGGGLNVIQLDFGPRDSSGVRLTSSQNEWGGASWLTEIQVGSAPTFVPMVRKPL
jgi:hypothetical protein